MQKNLVFIIGSTLKLEIIIILLENIEELFMIVAIWDTNYQEKFQWYFTMVLHTTIIW